MKLGISTGRWAAFALFTTLTAGATAAAGGAYYNEVEHDGRLYVFASADAFSRWELSGEITTAVTRVGYGPDGRTVVFDGEQAIALYDAEHGLQRDAPPQQPEPRPAELTWKGGKTTLEMDGATLVLSNRIQFRWTRLDASEDPIDSQGSFRIRRARTKLEATAFAPELSFTLQLDWADTANGLLDAYLGWDASKTGIFQLRLGQFKAPFGRQEMTSSGSLQFVDRSIVSSEFAKGRDIGVQAFGRTSSGRFEYYAGIFNGNGRTRTRNDNGSYQFDARLVWNPNGDPKLSEVDFESSDTPLWSLAAGYELNDRRQPQGDVAESERSTVGFDGAFKYRGVFVTGEGYLRRTTPEQGEAFDSNGYHLQGGYRFLGGWELAGRWARWDRDSDAEGDERTELGGALNYYHARHALKVQADIRRLEVGGEAAFELRVQVQGVF